MAEVFPAADERLSMACRETPVEYSSLDLDVRHVKAFQVELDGGSAPSRARVAGLRGRGIRPPQSSPGVRLDVAARAIRDRRCSPGPTRARRQGTGRSRRPDAGSPLRTMARASSTPTATTAGGSNAAVPAHRPVPMPQNETVPEPAT